MSVLFASVLTGCGGGDASQDPATAFVAGIAHQRSAPAGIKRERPAAASSIGIDELLDWAEYQFPALFPKGPRSFPLLHDGVNYTVRAYQNGNYLGVTPDGRIFGLGPFNGNVLTQYETIAYWSAQVIADRCKVYPGLCGGPVTGYNECVGPEAVTMPTGFRVVLTFVDVPDGTETTVDGIVDGPAQFEGRAAIQTTTRGTTSAVFEGVRTVLSTFESRTYEQNVPNGLPLLLGTEGTATVPDIVFGGFTIPGSTSRSRTVWDPPVQPTEFTLAAGQSITRTERSTTADLDDPTQPSTVSYTQTYTYEQRERITVAGKTFDTCRYRIADPTNESLTTAWYIVGKGIPARESTTTGNQTSTTELRPPSSYGGQSLF